MPLPDISESEWVLMEALWESSAAQTASQLARQLKPTTGWADNTVRTLLTRLTEKGAVQTGENESGTRLYSAAVKRADCVKSESRSFLKRVFKGAAKPLLVHFATHTQLSAEEVREIKKLLDDAQKEPRKDRS